MANHEDKSKPLDENDKHLAGLLPDEPDELVSRAAFVEKAKAVLCEGPPPVDDEFPFEEPGGFDDDHVRIELDDDANIEGEAPRPPRGKHMRVVVSAEDRRRKQRDRQRKERMSRGPAFFEWSHSSDEPETTYDDKSGKQVLDPQYPYIIAYLFLKQNCCVGGMLYVHRHREIYYRWNGKFYERVEKVQLEKMLYSFLSNCVENVSKDPDIETFVTFKINNNRTDNIIRSVISLISVDEKVSDPCWLDHTMEEEHPAQGLIACGNGLLNVKKLELLPFTPAYFSKSTVTANFEAEAAKPTRWISFLSEVFDGDEESIDLLQRWFGYCLTEDTSYQKMLMIIGASRSGKGTMLHVLQKLVGEDSAASMQFPHLCTNFGLWPLLDKKVAIFPDARMDARSNQAKVVSDLLSITGEDPVTVDRKSIAPITVRLGARIIIVSNEIPRFIDSSGALLNRTLLLRCKRSFLGREDIDLKQKLEAELPGILNWAIEGWQRLQSERKFVEPEASRTMREMFSEGMSPIKSFIMERCAIGENNEAPTVQLYEAFVEWCDEQGHRHGSQVSFGKQLMSALPQLERVHRGPRGARSRSYIGIRLKDAQLSLVPPPMAGDEADD